MKHLIVLLHSMRSHETGNYYPLLDGNINIMIHRMSIAPDIEYTITMPENVDDNQMFLLGHLCSILKLNVEFLFIEYGINAGETRDMLHESLQDIDTREYDHVEYHICNVQTTSTPHSFHIYNSPVIQIRRPYTERQYFNLIDKISNGKSVNFSSQSQVDMLPSSLAGKVTTDMKFFNPSTYDIIEDSYLDANLYDKLVEELPQDSYFFPFRISDDVYKFNKARELGTLLITDPNDSLDNTKGIVNLGGYNLCKKTLYITMLNVLEVRTDIKIPLYEDVFYNYHIGIIEMVYKAYNSLVFMDQEVPKRSDFDIYII